MKKLIILVFILIIAGGCTQEYKDIKPKVPLSGTIVGIDSAQWTPVLMQTGDDEIFILDKGEIREISLIKDIVYLLIGILIIALVFAILEAFIDR